MQFIADELTLAEDEDLLRRLNYIINQTRLRGCPPQKQDYERVFEAIRDQQCVCVYDISEETTFPPSVVWGIIDGLVAMGVLRPERGCAERDDYDTRFKVIGPLPSSSPVRP
ncbi:MAG TPA: hypothetical protein VN256_08190 [Pyrinomonadaceae bacterium]|nr:hypothetical protein [Pyrinomonadaceae bacterium]